MGMGHKILYNMDTVIYLYALNFLLVGIDMVLYYIYKNRPDKNTDAQVLEEKLEQEVHLRADKNAGLSV